MTPPPDLPAVLTTPLTTLLGIRHPILLAPMGDTAGGRLAAAVSAGGGLGLVGGGYADPEWLTRELAAAGAARVGVGSSPSPSIADRTRSVSRSRRNLRRSSSHSAIRARTPTTSTPVARS